MCAYVYLDDEEIYRSQTFVQYFWNSAGSQFPAHLFSPCVNLEDFAGPCHSPITLEAPAGTFEHNVNTFPINQHAVLAPAFGDPSGWTPSLYGSMPTTISETPPTPFAYIPHHDGGFGSGVLDYFTNCSAEPDPYSSQFAQTSSDSVCFVAQPNQEPPHRSPAPSTDTIWLTSLEGPSRQNSQWSEVSDLALSESWPQSPLSSESSMLLIGQGNLYPPSATNIEDVSFDCAGAQADRHLSSILIPPGVSYLAVEAYLAERENIDTCFRLPISEGEHPGSVVASLLTHIQMP